MYLKNLIERGCVKVGGETKPADYDLKIDERVRVDWPSSDWTAMPLKDWTIFEDKNILVINKPARLLMHPMGQSWLTQPEATATE